MSVRRVCQKKRKSLKSVQYSNEVKQQARAMELIAAQPKLPKRKIPLDSEKEGQINWEKKYEELLEWVDSGQSQLIEWVKDEEPETEVGDIHLILDYGRKRKKKGRKNSLWESSERRKAKSKPDCNIRIEYRVPKDVATLESEGFDQADILNYPKRAHLRPRVISWMKDKGNDGPIRKLVHTVEKKTLAKLTNNPFPLNPPVVSNVPNTITTFTFPLLNLTSYHQTAAASASLQRALPTNTSFQLKYLNPPNGSTNGRELIKIFGSNFHDKLQLFWDNTPIEFVCKNSTEMWCGSLPSASRTTAVILVKDRDGGSQHLYFTYQDFQTPENVEETLMETEDRTKAPSLKAESEGAKDIQSTSEVKEEVIKEKEPEKVESELERNVAVSLASLSDTFMRGNASTFVNETAVSNAKRARAEISGRTKLVCKKCRYVLCADCSSELQFERASEELQLWTRIQKGWTSLSRRLGTTVEEVQSSCPSVICHACDQIVGTEHKINGEPCIKFICSQILLDKNGEMLGADSFESLRGKLLDVQEVSSISQTTKNSPIVRVPTLQNVYDGNNDLNELLKKFYADRQCSFQHAGCKAPSCLTKS